MTETRKKPKSKKKKLCLDWERMYRKALTENIELKAEISKTPFGHL